MDLAHKYNLVQPTHKYNLVQPTHKYNLVQLTLPTQNEEKLH